MSSDYILPSTEAESERLEQQAALYGGMDFLREFLRDQPAELLEVGCGTGHFTRAVALALPHSRVLGVDTDAQRLAFARLRNPAPNLVFEHADLLALPYPDASFGLVFCRFVLVHLKDPTRALQEMARVTRPGGRVVAYDMVHDAIWFSPEKPSFARLLGQALAIMRERGMEPSQGLHLASGMIRAGLEQVQARPIAHHALAGEPVFELHRQNWLHTVASLSELLGARFDQELVDRARAELEHITPDQFLLELTVLAHGRKTSIAPAAR